MTISDDEMQRKVNNFKLSQLELEKSELIIKLVNANTAIGILNLRIAELSDGHKAVVVGTEDKLMASLDAGETASKLHAISLSELENRNEALTLLLVKANSEIAEFQLQIVKNAEKESEFIIKLKETSDEIERLGMVLHRREIDKNKISQLNKPKHSS